MPGLSGREAIRVEIRSISMYVLYLSCLFSLKCSLWLMFNFSMAHIDIAEPNQLGFKERSREKKTPTSQYLRKVLDPKYLILSRLRSFHISMHPSPSLNHSSI